MIDEGTDGPDGPEELEGAEYSAGTAGGCRESQLAAAPAASHRLLQPAVTPRPQDRRHEGRGPATLPAQLSAGEASVAPVAPARRTWQALPGRAVQRMQTWLEDNKPNLNPPSEKIAEFAEKGTTSLIPTTSVFQLRADSAHSEFLYSHQY